MHLSSSSSTPVSRSRPGDRGISVSLRRLLFRKLWLPRIVYEMLPYIYMVAGGGALYAATQLGDWRWVLPYAVLLGLICLHAGLGIAALRYRFRKGRKDT